MNEFPVTEQFAYLNHAAVAPLPRRAVQRMAAMAEDVSRSGDQHWADRNRETERVRGLAEIGRASCRERVLDHV